ncbi:alpha-amylase family glycosyl hydrolase [Vibrio furnissii]|nr:alpha-amylase family glycosyl hydrolase [Vibrio furnissii]
MRLFTFVLTGLTLTPLPSTAEWYFRGTANQWVATQMAAINDNQYQTCQSFASGDDGGGPRFKIDRTGNWNESYPEQDFGVTENQSYIISFFVDSTSITTEPVSSCESDIAMNWGSAFFRGTPNEWQSTPLTLIDDHVWQVDITFDGSSEQRFKIDILGDWSQNYGDNENDQVLDLDGDDIYTSVTGVYRLQINDQTLAYSLTALNTENQLPNALITLDTEQSVIAGTSITFSAQGSSDADGDIVSYLWDSGETSDTLTRTFAEEGTYTISVTVTDDSGAQSVASVTITVSSAAVSEWFFRGTPNNWATTEMVSQDQIVYCTEQSFANSDPRFKIDRYGDWTESYPTEDFRVDGDALYSICIDSQTKEVSAQQLASEDKQAPVVTASPSGGIYSSSQSITLSVSDNQDANPLMYFTTDGSTPHTGSPLYQGEIIQATDIGDGIDLVIKTLSVDASGNQQVQSFSYYIGEQIASDDFRQETIYFVLTARFYDGDSSNNYYNRDRIKAGDPHWRGDFKGLISQLAYIKDLGFTAIWVTPPVENRSGLDYHGYHAYDFYTVDPRLESPDASYQDFINAAHDQGLKVIQDVVINHSSQYGLRDAVWIDHLPIKYYVPAGGSQGEISNDPYFGHLGDYRSTYRDDNDNSVAPDWFRARHNSDPEGTTPLVDPNTGVTVPLAGYDANRFFGIDAQTLDPAWYHLDGFMSGGDWENPTSLQNKHMAGDCIDLATENQNVKDYINGAIHQYLDMGVDAIRLDTVKHIARDELLEYVNDWKAYKPGLFVFGENLVKGTGFGSELDNDNASAVIRPWWYTRTTQDPADPNAGVDSGFSVLDFSIFSTFRDNVTKGSFGGIGGVLGWDWVYGDATKLVTFFQNHDVGPDNDFKYRYGGDVGNAAMVYNLMWTNRGIPALYYGEEIMFQAGLPQDIAGATDTLDMTGRAYFGPHLDDKANTQSHPLYLHIQRLNQIRKAIPALQKAPTSQVNEWGSGISYVRDYNNGESYAVVGLSDANTQTITVSDVRNGTYTDAVTGNQILVSSGSLTFNVKGYSAGIYVLNGPGQIGTDGQFLR